MAKTSIHIKPCNIGQSEAHNMRTKEYLAHINADRLYIREDLTSSNLSWVADQQPGSRKRPVGRCRLRNEKG